MSLHPCIQAKVAYGTKAEAAMLTVLSELVGEPLTKTSHTFDSFDAVGTTTFTEQKTRTNDWSYNHPKIQKEGWLIPSSKILRGWEELSKGKKVLFFYLWSFDKSLWMFEMKPTDFTDDVHFVPKNHYDNQLHVAIPQSRWTRCDVDLSFLAFDEDKCWIED